MKIDPNRTQAPLAKKREELVELARDVVESGASLTTPRFCSWLFGHRKLDPEEVPDKLQEGKLDVKSREGAPRLPVHSAEDLTEVAVFQGVLPPETLPHPELVTGLQQLQQAGWNLADLDAYGAYNVLTEQGKPLQVRQGNFLVPLPREQVAPMAKFYQEDPLAQLERKGYEFFDSQGKPRPSWGDLPPARVGKGGKPWLDVSATDELDDFAQLVQETGSPDQARVIQSVHDVAAARAHMKDPGMVPGLMRACERASTHEILSLGAALEGPSQKAFLEGLVSRPDTSHQGRTALKALWVCPQAGNALIAALPPTPLDSGVSKAGYFTQVLAGIEGNRRLDYQTKAGIRTSLSAHILQALQECPDTQKAADRVAALKPKDNVGAVRVLLGMPTTTDLDLLTDSLPANGDPALQERIGGTESLPMKLRAAVGEQAVKDIVFALRQPVTTGVEAAQFYSQVLSKLDANRNLDWQAKSRERATICEHALATLRTLPDTQPGAERIVQLDPKDRVGAVRALLGNGTASLEVLTRAVPCQGDFKLQEKLLAELPAQQTRIPGELRQLTKEPAVKDLLFELSRAGQSFATGGDTALFYAQVLARVDANRSLDWQTKNRERTALCEHALKTLETMPDSQAAARKVRELKPVDRVGAIRVLLGNPTASTPQQLTDLARALPNGNDPALQARLMNELPGDLTDLPNQLRGVAKEDSVQRSIYELTMQQRPLQTGSQAARFYLEVVQAIDRNRNLDWQSKNKERTEICEHALKYLRQQPDTQAAVEELLRLDPRDRVAATRILLQNPDAASLASSLPTAGDHALQDKLLARLPSKQTKLPLELRRQLSASSLKDAVYELTMARPPLATGVELAAFYQQVLARVDKDRNLDWQEKNKERNKLVEHAFATLARQPDTSAAVRRIEDLKPRDRPGALRVLLSDPGTKDLKTLGRLLPCGSDSALQDRLLAELPAGSPVPLTLRGKVRNESVRTHIFNLALREPDLTSGEKLAGFYRDVLQGVDKDRNLDYQEKTKERQLVCRHALETLKSQPDTAVGAGLVLKWAPADPVTATRALLETPTVKSELELGMRAVGVSDRRLQDALLAELESQPESKMAARLARDAMQLVKADEARHAICLTALEHRQLSKKEDVEAFMAALDARMSRLRHDGFRQDRERVRSMGTAAVEVMLLAQKPAPSAIDEQDERVIVGGVPIKKK